jgi:nuclear pore complex protein Nup205
LRLLKSERIQLASLLYRASDQRLISALDVTKLIQWISEAATSDVSPYIICATLSSINPRNHNGDGPLTLVGDPNFVRFANQQLGSSAAWRAPNSRSTKALLDLAWSLFRLWHSNSESHGLFLEDELETDMRKAIENDAFQRLLLLVIQAETSEAKFGQDPLSYAAALRRESPELSDSQYSSYREPVEDSFKPLVLKTAEDLVTDLIASAAPVLKSLRTRQEDLLGANTRTRVASNAPPKQKPRNDTAVFFSLLGTLYASLPPDSALHFWVAADVNKSMFPKLLRWASDAHEKSTALALFEMVSGLSHGKRCSEEAYNFLSSAAGGDGDRNYGGGPTPLLSWRYIFRMLDNLKTKIPDPRLPSQSRNQDLRVGHGQASPSITPEEVYQLNGFLTILRTVAAHSTRARMALFKHSSFKLIPTLVSMIPRHIPLELKGSIFNTLAAFCIAGAGAQGVELCKNIWSQLEEVEVIGAQHNKAMFGGGGEMDSGVAFELEEIEIPAKRYPSSLSFIRLLGCLIHAPKAIPLSKRMLQYEPTGTVPDNLGAPRRAPGVLPYTRFIIDKIILPTLNGSREYSDIDDKWEMLDTSFAYLENCLASYSMEDLYQPEMRDNTLGTQSLMGRYFTHPGFGVLHEMLTDSPLIHAVLAYVHQGTLHMESQTSNSSPINPLFQNTMLRVMRIIHRVLDIQTPFLEVFAPVAAELDTKSILGSQFSVSLLTGLDQRLVWSPGRVVSIALCAVYGRQSELVLMSIRTLSALAGSPSWLSTNQTSSLSSRRHINRLAVALDRNAESDNILSAFVRILNREVSEEMTEAELDFTTGAGAPIQGSNTSFDGALRWEVLDLLLENTNGSRPGPNLAHLLLGFSQEGMELTLEDPHAFGARVSCLHVVLRHLRRGIKGQLSDGSAHDQHLRPLYQSNTTFAEKCYRLIYQLCTQDITRDTTMRYLRNQENFFVRQLASMPAIVPTTLVTGSPGIISYADQSQVATTCETITAFLRLRSYLLEVVAQEIHLLTQSGQRRNVQELMNILFTSSNLSGESVTEGMNSLLGSRFSSRQSLDTIIELFMSFDFEWQEGQEVGQVDLAFYRSVNLLAALRPDPAGCELIDREVLMQILFNAKTQVQNELTSTTALTQLERETAYILSSCTVENHRREIQHAKGFGLESWRRLLEVCLAKCFDQLSLERRESLLCDLLLALPSVIGSGSVSAFGMIALSETVLTLMTKLREERTKYTDSPYDFGVPSEKLISIFKKILECVLDPNAPELVRGNLYASLISYFHMINPNASKPTETNYEAFSDSVSLDSSFSRSVNDRAVTAEPGVLKQSVYTVNLVVDKLVQVIGRDAIDGSELWRSVAFSVLDCLTRLSRREKQHRVLAALVKQGILHTFIGSVSELDADLEMIYSADPGELTLRCHRSTRSDCKLS